MNVALIQTIETEAEIIIVAMHLLSRPQEVSAVECQIDSSYRIAKVSVRNFFHNFFNKTINSRVEAPPLVVGYLRPVPLESIH